MFKNLHSNIFKLILGKIIMDTLSKKYLHSNIFKLIPYSTKVQKSGFKFTF